MAFQKKHVPASQRTSAAEEIDQDKVYQFELIKTHEKYKPTDEQGRTLGLPYPPSYSVPNRGVVFDEITGKQRRFRYMYGQPSIWEDEQDIDPTPQEMAEAQHELEFKNGILRVNGFDTAKIAALMALDMFEGKKKRLIANTVPIYRLINPDDVTNALLKTMDDAYEAEKAAREMSEEDMLIFANALGIDMTKGISEIKKDFLIQAKTNPSNFIKQAVNPKNKYLYAFKEAFRDNLISCTIQPGKLIFVGNGSVICDVLPKDDMDVIAERLSKDAANDEKVAKLLYTQLENAKAAV